MEVLGCGVCISSKHIVSQPATPCGDGASVGSTPGDFEGDALAMLSSESDGTVPGGRAEAARGPSSVCTPPAPWERRAFVGLTCRPGAGTAHTRYNDRSTRGDRGSLCGVGGGGFETPTR